MGRWWLALPLAALLIFGSSAAAKDWSKEWKFGVLLQPRLELVDGKEPTFRWRRVRGTFGGPISSRALGRIQIDRTKPALKLIESYVDYQAVKGPVPVALRLGLGYPAWSKDAYSSPVGAEYAMVTDLFRLSDRWFGAQANTTLAKQFQFSAGIYNGSGTVLTGPNTRPSFVGSAAWLGKPVGLRLWGISGFDRDRATNQQRPDRVYGVDLLAPKLWGRAFAEAGWVDGQRFGKRMRGAYGDLGYEFSAKGLAFVRCEWADTNRDVPDAKRQRWTLSTQQRLTWYCLARCDLRYEQGTGQPEAILQLDFKF